MKNKKQVPAPNEYNTRQLTNKGKDIAPSRTIAGRAKDPQPYKTPAPGTYDLDDGSVVESSPRYSFGVKTTMEHPNGVPAPNAYDMPDSLGQETPRYTIRGRGRDEVDERVKYPAPCQYEPAKADAALNKSPAYSLRDRTALPMDRTKKPGPGAYNLDDKSVKARDPQYSFGLKHSPYVGSFKPGQAEGTVTLQTSAVRPTDKVLRGGEVVRVTPEGLTCRWVDRGLSPRSSGTSSRTMETRVNSDGSTTTRQTTSMHRTVQMSM
ncbi:outer dense fiber protein 3-like [Pollicipes pollicipes]|uniref:outer dense fiber protein 3-like n=1 Tax=Pollicipes pollicipes TaxID=41117 RepID=UPI001884F83F|nr:outer dense fiber protein 3-like [Pollicipes pollicipes]